MPSLRRRLSVLGFALLLFQAAGFAVSPIVSCYASAAQPAEADDECCKGLAPGQMCPMHHHPHRPDAAPQHDGAARLRCGCTTVDPALVSLAFGLGVMTPPVSLDVTTLSVHVARHGIPTLESPAPIDSPPPRG
jgi:hypothetical protein